MNTNNDDFTYDELNFDGLERRGNYRIIAYREDVLHALDRKDPAAIIYQIVFRWQTEFKKPEVLKKIEERKKAGLKPYTPKEIEDMMYVFMSYNDFVRESGGALGYNTVIRMLDYLINTKKVLYQRENHNPKYPDFEYSVNKNAMRELLKALPIEPVFAPKIPKKKSKSTQMGIVDNGSGYSTQMGIPTDEIDSTHLGTQSTQTGIASTQVGTEVYPNGGTSHITTHTTHSNHTEGDTVALSDDERETPSPSLQQFFTPTEECMCMYCQRVYKNSEIAATLGDLAPCGHDKNALFDVADNPQVNGEDDGTSHTDNRVVYNHNDALSDAHLLDALGHQNRTDENQQPTQQQIPQLNRLINPVSTASQEIVSTDESPREIEAETAEHTPSSPVVNAATDEVIHENTQSATNSYSPSSTAKTTSDAEPVTEQAETPEQNAAEEKPKRRRTRRTRKVPPPFEVPEELKPRVEKVYAFLNKWRQLKLNDPEECFERDAESDEAVCSLFNGKPPTEKRLEVLCERIWNEKRNPNTGYLPREHMTVKTICKQYKAQSMSLAADEKQAKGIVSTATQIAGYTRQFDTDDEDIVYQSKAERTQRKRA